MDAFVRRIKREYPHLSPLLEQVVETSKPKSLEELKDAVDRHVESCKSELEAGKAKIDADRLRLLKRLRNLQVSGREGPAPVSTRQHFSEALERSGNHQATAQAGMALNSLSLLIAGEIMGREMIRIQKEREKPD